MDVLDKEESTALPFRALRPSVVLPVFASDGNLLHLRFRLPFCSFPVFFYICFYFLPTHFKILPSLLISRAPPSICYISSSSVVPRESLTFPSS